MGIKIEKPGVLSTLQDLGRYGYQKSGMVVSGAMDTLALRIGNLLLGNPADEAGIECTLIGPTICFEYDQLIALTGADLSPSADSVPVPMWRPVYVRKGTILSFGKANSGCRTYISVRGGFAVQEILSSKSTYLHAGIGGWKGRALQANDRIPFQKPYSGNLQKFNWRSDPQLYPDLATQQIRVLNGPELEQFTETSILQFSDASFTISQQADRMGFRLNGPALELRKPTEMLSAAVTFGTIQVTPQGTAIVLMADRQTTGGYPRIAQVASVDLTLLAQMQPGQSLSFEFITLAEAQALLLKREQQINQLQQTLTFKYGSFIPH